MSKINDLERQIEALSPEELASFRKWFTEPLRLSGVLVRLPDPAHRGACIG
jgi:hypothetical protein